MKATSVLPWLGILVLPTVLFLGSWDLAIAAPLPLPPPPRPQLDAERQVGNSPGKLAYLMRPSEQGWTAPRWICAGVTEAKLWLHPSAEVYMLPRDSSYIGVYRRPDYQWVIDTYDSKVEWAELNRMPRCGIAMIPVALQDIQPKGQP
jgi:hypothetical protein